MKGSSTKLMLMISVVIAAVLISNIWYINSNREKKKQSALILTPATLNLGEVLQYHVASASVVVTNTSDHPIQIIDIQHSCGCTNYAIDAVALKSGKSTALRITVNAQNRDGPFHVSLTLSWKDMLTNQTGNSIISINVTAKSLCRLSTPIIDFHSLDSDAKPAVMQLMIQRGSANIKWNNLDVKAQVTNSYVLKRLGPDIFLLTYTIRPATLPIGVYKDNLRLDLEDGIQSIAPDVEIPVCARITSNLEVSPLSIYWGVMRRNDRKTGNFVIESRDDKPIRLVSFECPSSLEMRIAEEKSRYVRFSYQSTKAVPLGSVDQSVLITVLTDRKRIIKIPVIAFVL